MQPMSDSSVYRQRRAHLLEQMRHGIAVLPTAEEVARNGDTHYAYRHDSSFYYLTGFAEPEAVLVLIAGDEPQSILFCREKNPEREIWDGFRCGPEAAQEQYGFDAAYPIAQLDEKLTELLGNQPTLFYPLGGDAAWDQRILRLRSTVQARSRSGIRAPDEIRDVRALLHEMRLIKDGRELDIMRRAAAVSAQAHRRAMQFVRPGQFEYQIEGELLHEFCHHGSRHPAYPSIVAGGANACVLHYIGNSARLNDGDLLLIDAGCEVEGYAADITRTFPVNGKFSDPQKDVYEIVLAAQAAAAAEVKPGNRWDAPHEAAVMVLAQGLVDLGLCAGTRDAVIESGDYKRFYMHRTGHWLGLDVHDAGDYKQAGEWKPLAPGMTLTVEPGCYIRPAEGVPERFWNVGVRIEDDALVTESGCELITAAAPKRIDDIEALMRDAA